MSPPARAQPFPFLVGRGRSGTTLLRSIFDSHPEMAIPDESHFLIGLSRRRRRYERVDGFAVDAFVGDVSKRPGFRSMEIPVEVLQADLRSRTPADYPEAVRRIYAIYARRHGKSRYGDKTPIHVMKLPQLAGLFPEARFVHIIRDGRDVADSYLDVAWGPDDVVEAALLWKRAVEAGRRGGRALGPHRYREVRYEDLVEDPEGTVQDLCRFVELRFDPVMLRYYERAGEVAGKMGMPEARRSLYLPPTRGIRDWRTQMRNVDVVAFEAVSGALLEELGYERGAPAPGVAARLRARGWQLRLRVHRARRATDLLLRKAWRRSRRFASRMRHVVDR